MNKKFPNGFLWGSSTNAQQFEGGRNKDDVGLSIADVRIDDGKGMTHEDSNYDMFQVASDHYHHLEEDIDLYGEMGFQIYRFSMSWTRIFPCGNDEKPNQAGLDFYNRMLTKLEEYNIQPVCTLYAYDLPLHLVEKYKGFLSRECIDDFLNYVDVVSKYFKGRIKYYVPFNEQNTMAMISKYCVGVQANNLEEVFLIDHHLNLAWAKATKIIHQNDANAKVGGNVCNTCIYPATCNPLDIEKADESERAFGYGYADIFARRKYSPSYLNKYKEIDINSLMKEGDLDIIANAQPDFLSLTYYMSTLASASEGVGDTLLNTTQGNPYTKQTEWGWNIDAYGFKRFLVNFYERYQMPILILENGLGHTDVVEANGTINDDYRIEYLSEHIKRMQEAIELGVEIIGYCTWSATDLYSTHEGFEKRYGFVYVDGKTFERKRKKSFYWYKKVIASNGEDLRNDSVY